MVTLYDLTKYSYSERMENDSIVTKSFKSLFINDYYIAGLQVCHQVYFTL